MKKLFPIQCITLLIACILMVLPAAAQRDRSQRPSPPAKAECKLADGKKITVDYSSPQMRGRKIFGELVPFGKVWRAGANEATTFVPETDVVVGGTPVPAGSYTLYVLPEENKWTLIISKKTGQWGIPYPGEANDLARVEMKVSALAQPMEGFTIQFEEKGGGCTLHMSWEKTRASVQVTQKK